MIRPHPGPQTLGTGPCLDEGSVNPFLYLPALEWEARRLQHIREKKAYLFLLSSPHFMILVSCKLIFLPLVITAFECLMF